MDEPIRNRNQHQKRRAAARLLDGAAVAEAGGAEIHGLLPRESEDLCCVVFCVCVGVCVEWGRGLFENKKNKRRQIKRSDSIAAPPAKTKQNTHTQPRHPFYLSEAVAGEEEREEELQQRVLPLRPHVDAPCVFTCVYMWCACVRVTLTFES